MHSDKDCGILFTFGFYFTIHLYILYISIENQLDIYVEKRYRVCREVDFSTQTHYFECLF